MNAQEALLRTSIPESPTLKFLSSGKVRDLYSVKEIDGEAADGEYLLFVATDRISAFDVVLRNGIPGKGCILTSLSLLWFNKLKGIIPNHVVASSLETMPPSIRSQIAPYWKDQLEGRTLLVRKAKIVKLEAIVRGYLTGSAWAEYQKSRTVHGIPLSDKYVESSKLDEPLFTPSTKADAGEHDENISPEHAMQIIGEDLYNQVSRASLDLYKAAHDYAYSCGLILADTKFEFGLVPDPSAPSGSRLILVDEVLTPDSSRYWGTGSYVEGKSQESFDKQFLRDWLKEQGFRKGLEAGPDGKGWFMTDEVIERTTDRYRRALSSLTATSST